MLILLFLWKSFIFLTALQPLNRVADRGALHAFEFNLIGRCHDLKNGKEASEVTEGKSSRMRWGW